MKKILLLLGSMLLIWHTDTLAQRKCGIEAERAAMIAKDPTWKDRFDAQRNSLQSIADNYGLLKKSGAAERTTATISPVPVIFHILVTNAQLANLGGIAGIEQRCDSQIVVLNRDYNRQNADSVYIPSGWTHLYANVGIHFGLAHTTPSGNGTPGYELLIIPDAPGGFSSGSYGDYSDAKYTATGGLAAWDNTKYMNVWCINFADDPSLLGITSPLSFTVGSGAIPLPEMGICMNYLALGKRTAPSDDYIPTGYGTDYYDQGRTLTHEVGHFFEIWHTWGDDYGLCPWDTPWPGCPNGGDPSDSGAGQDDGLADTPPEGDHQFFNLPYSITGGTYNDCCQYMPGSTTDLQPFGLCSQCFINYTDDIGMHMFTTDQANAMASMVLLTPGTTIGGTTTGATNSGIIGETYSLTQNPALLTYPANAAVSHVDLNSSLTISPNPTTGMVNISYNSNTDVLMAISVINMLGQEVNNINTTGMLQDYYSIDLSAMSKGIYFVRCNFASGSVTRKILLQ